ncbi:MAG: DUF2269 domain-containing protein [Nitrospiraceae bacterium]
MIELASVTNLYLWVKTFHMIGASVLLGTGFGSAFFKWHTDRTGDLSSIVFVSKTVVLVDKIFTTPAVVLQFSTGIAMVWMGGYALTQAWLSLALGLFIFIGACWLPAVYIQMRCRDLAVEAQRAGAPLPPDYRRLSRIWFWLGACGFTAIWIVVGLMIMKPHWV